jgi:DNA mismatch repair protein MutS
MRQWREVKSRNRDALVFFRVGDFYELFYEDAQRGSRLLGLTLTSRNNGAAARVPLAGIPVKALDEYLRQLVRQGERVAICEQVEDPATAKGIVRREVVETVTPGTVVHDALLDADRNNFLVAISPPSKGEHGVAAVDLSTGELVAQKVDARDLSSELGRLEPSELLIPRSMKEEGEGGLFLEADGPGGGTPRTFRDDWTFDFEIARDELLRRFKVHSLEGFGLQRNDEVLVRACGALVSYLAEIQPSGVAHLRQPLIRRSGEDMVLDEMTRRNLELVDSLRPGEDGGTLLSVLDETVTAMGARLLRQWILRPLVLPEKIWARQTAVEELFERPEERRTLRDLLRQVCDLERVSAKVSSGRVTPRELVALGASLERLPAIRSAIGQARSTSLGELVLGMDLLEDVRDAIARTLSPDAPATLGEGGVIRAGYNAELDELRAALHGARDFIASLQARERSRTGIASLKVGFNKVFGYYLEVTKANLDRVPQDYVRKQTLANAERYFTPELKEWEEKVFGAEERVASLEMELFGELRAAVLAEVTRLQDAADRLAQVDVLSTFATTAERRRYSRPEVHTGFDLDIRAGRHAVVETMMPPEEFIPNDVILDADERIVILTGPNMAGKSTVLRQVGLIQLLAQTGSFVPADSARIPVADRIFTRVGASDNLARGQSTFMVEMTETAGIVHGATGESLVLLDEIGRGTSTYDGVSIAWAVTEHLHEEVGAKTIFATHYHELTQLADLLPAVKNLNVSVREVEDEIVFLRRLEPGGADRSYGIQVARLAGLPAEVIERAAELLKELEGTHSRGGEGLGRFGRHRPASGPSPDQLSLFHPSSRLVEELRSIDENHMTPVDALNLLADLARRARGES